MSMFEEVIPHNDEDIDDDSLSPQLAGRQVMTRKELINSRARMRNAVNRDAKEAEERARNTASMLLSYSEREDWYRQRNERRNKYEGVAYGVTNMANKVLQSLDINVPLRVDADPHTRSYGITDYESIDITLNIPESDIDTINNTEVLSDLVFRAKGMVYHEGGHIMWTYPFDNLVAEVTNTIGAVGCESIVRSILGEYVTKHAPSLIGDYNEMVSRLSLSQFMQRMMFPAWGVLEDQRMETAMCYTSPIMSRYFTEIVLASVIDPQNPGTAWPWVTGRTYLPSDIRQVLRDMAETNGYSQVIDDINEQVFKYRKSNDVLEMFECVVRMTELMYLWYQGCPDDVKQPGNDHHKDSGSGGAKTLPVVPNPYEHDMEKPNKVKGSQSPSDGQGEEQDDGQGESQSSDPSTSGDLASQYGKLADNERAKQNEGSRKDEVDSVASDINKHRNADIKPFVNPHAMSSDEVAKSKAVANGMISVLESLHSQVDPSWRFYQEHGVLDPVAFSMSEPGDDRYWSGLDDIGANGHNLAVSVLLDVSGSMGGHGEELSVTAMGIRKACEYFSIPCTITTFSDDARMFVEGDVEEANFMSISIGGGTNVYGAISKISDQTYGKANHLVVILTDGEWSDVEDIRPWVDNNKYIILVGFRMYDQAINKMRKKGANEVVNIRELSKLPQLMTSALAGFMAK